MQIKDKYLNLNPIFTSVIKVMVVILACYVIISKFKNHDINLSEIQWPGHYRTTFLIVLALMVVNWALEAFKWKTSIEIFEKISFMESMRVVLVGLALNWIFPFSTGDVITRLTSLKSKARATSAMVVNRSIMMLITIVYGLISVKYYSGRIEMKWPFLIGLLSILLGLILFRKALSKFSEYFHILSTKAFLQIGLLSLVRYLVFVTQFYLLLDLFLPDIPPVVKILGIGWIFFFRTMLPSFFGGVGIREASGLIFFSDVDNLTSILLPIFFIWLVNTVVPSIGGLVFLSLSKRKAIK